VAGEVAGGRAGASGAAAGTLSAAWSDVDRLAAASRRAGSTIWGLSIGLSLNGDREQAEDDHVKAELGDRRMAEQLLEPAQMQDGRRTRRMASAIAA
jgi:hypothetical protein